MGAIFSGASLSQPKSSPLQSRVTIRIGNSFKGLQMTEKRDCHRLSSPQWQFHLHCVVQGKHTFILPIKQLFL